MGEFNFIPDVEALVAPEPEREYQARAMWYEQVLKSEGQIMQDGYKFKHKDALTKMAELVKIKDGEQYFEKIDENELIQAGANGQGAMPGGQELPRGQAVPGGQPPPQQPAGQGIPQAQPQGMGGALPVR